MTFAKKVMIEEEKDADKKNLNEPSVPYGDFNFELKKKISIFNSFEEAAEAEREQIRRLSGEQRLQMVVALMQGIYKDEIERQKNLPFKIYFK